MIPDLPAFVDASRPLTRCPGRRRFGDCNGSVTLPRRFENSGVFAGRRGPGGFLTWPAGVGNFGGAGHRK
jgi:hypothetical protein